MGGFPLEEERKWRGNCRKLVWEPSLGGKGNFYNEPRSGVRNTGY